MDSIKSQLMDMGFSESKVKRAIESCSDAQTLEQVMEWLIAHEDELNAEPAIVHQKPAPNVVQKTSTVEPKVSGGETSSQTDEKRSVTDGSQQHDDGKPETAAHMAARKKITVEEAQKLITERQARRLEEERKKAIEDEKKRRLNGQKMAETRAELADQERVRLAQQIRREKAELAAHKKQLLEQIARDREAMKARSKPAEAKSSSTSASATKPPASNQVVKGQQPKNSATECRIALRFPDGSNLMHKFSPQEQLAAVRLFVQMEKACEPTTSIEFVAPPNKKLADSLMNETLESLGLCPASRLEVKLNQKAWVDLD